MTAKRRVRLMVLAGLGALALSLLWVARGALYPFFLGVLIAYLLNPLVALLERRGAGRLWALAAVYTVLAAAAAGAGIKLVPLLVRELENFARDLPSITREAEALLGDLETHYRSWALPESMRRAVDEAIGGIGAEADLFVRELVQQILGLFSYAVGIAVSPVLAFYILYDWQNLREKTLFMLPAAWRARCVRMAGEVNVVLHGVIRGQILTSLLVAALVTAGLYALQIPYALLIGALAGALDVIPYFGALIGALPAVGMALLQSPAAVLKVTALFFVVHQLEGSVIQPKIVGKTAGLHPLTVIFFAFVGGELGGLVGMLLSVPLAAIGKVCLRHFMQLLL